jgi:hypothetical protein
MKTTLPITAFLAVGLLVGPMGIKPAGAQACDPGTAPQNLSAT